MTADRRIGNRYRFQDVTGQQFSRLYVLAEVPKAARRDQRRVEYLCRCACGVEKAVSSDDLKHGRIKSCGCLKRDYDTKPRPRRARKVCSAAPVLLRNQAWRDYRRNARTRALLFTVTKEQFNALLFLPCAYCGAPPAPRNGVDRVNNALGYTLGNIVTCCRTCNIAKGKLSVVEFTEWAARVTRFTAQCQQEAA